MKTQLLIAAAGAAGLATYFFLKNKYAKRSRYTHLESNSRPGSHHLTQVFANAKKHAMS